MLDHLEPSRCGPGSADGRFVATVPLSGVARTSTYTLAYDTRPGFLRHVSDGDRLTGAHAWTRRLARLQQVTLAIRARVPVPVLLDVIQPFPTFS